MCGALLKPISKLAGGLVPKPATPPPLPATADPSVAKTQAAEAAAASDLERRRKVKAGGRASTLLAGQSVAQEQQKKTLLGQ
jgi:hypothetical protein